MTSLATTASAHCPDGGECFTVEDAERRLDEECSEARDKMAACKSKLADCDGMEAKLNACRGKLNESRKGERRQQRTIRTLDRDKATMHDTSTVVLWTIGGVSIGIPVGILAYQAMK